VIHTAVDGSLKFDTKIDTDGFERGTNTIKSQANGLKSTIISLGKTMAVVFGVRQLIRFGKQAVETASDLQEVQNVVDTAFGDMTYKMEEFAKTSIETFGLSKLAAKQNGSTFMAMAKNMLKSQKVASDMAVTLTGLTGDWASFYNVTTGEAATALNGVFTGETEVLKRYGYVMTEANLQAFAFENGIKKKISAMTQEEKVMLRYNYIMEKSAMVQGDFAKTSDSWANQTRVLTERWKEFLGIIGTGLIQVLTPAVRFLNTAMTYMISMAKTVTEILSSVFGLDMQISDSTTSIGSAAKDAAGGYTDMGDAAEEAGKKANKAIAPFDDLNQITNDKNGSGSGIGAISAPSIEIDVGEGLDGSNSALVKSFDNLKKAIDPTLEALGRFKDAIEPLGKFVFDNIKSLYEDILKPLGGWILGEGLPRLLDVAGKLISSINWDKLSSALSNFNKAIAPFAIAVGEGLILFIEGLADILSPILATTADALAVAINAIAEAIKLIPEEVAIAIGGAIGGIATAVLIFNGAKTVASIIKKIGTAIGGFLTTLSAHPLLVLAIGLSAIVGAAIALNKARFNNSKIQPYIDKVNALVESSKELNDEIDEFLKSQDEKERAIETEYGAVEILAEKYFDLADNANKTNAEKELMKKYAQELIKQIPELNTLIDEETGAYKGTKDEIIQLISKTKEYYLVQAAQDSLIELAKKKYEAERDLKLLGDELSTTTDTLAQKEKDYEDAIRAATGTREEYDEWLRTHKTSADELGTEVEKLKTAEKDLKGQLEETQGSVQEIDKEITYAEQYMKDYATTAQKEMPKVKTAVDSALGKIKKAVEDFKIPMVKIPISWDDIPEMPKLVTQGKFPTYSGSSVSYPQYATGTVVPANYGNFLAVMGDNKREPEVVSPVSTMKQAMKEAMKEMGGSSNGTTIIQCILDGKIVYESVVKQNKYNTRRTGKNLLTE
jgi:uncharacterized coiled-coil DUF342 family protein